MAKSIKKKKNITFNFLNRFMIIQFVLMLALSLFITKKVSDSAKTNANEHLSAIANERALIVTEFISQAESKLRLFVENPDVRKLIEEPNDRYTQINTQSLIKEYVEEITGCEGLYIASWDTKILMHSNEDVVATIIREAGDSRAELQSKIRRRDNKIYNAGVVETPTSQRKVLALYKGIYKEDGTPIGFVGLDLNADYVMQKLAEIQTPGLQHSTYTMMDVIEAAYVFDQDDPSNCGKPVVLPDLIRTCEDYRSGTNTDITTTYEYALPGLGSFVGASVWMPEQEWVLMMNDQKSEVYSLVNAMKMFLGIFSALILALMIFFALLNKKQEKVNQKLVTSMERMNQAKQSLNSAMFNDVLTDAGNRVKFTIAVSDITDGTTNPYYFAMFNLMDFSSINTAFGSDTGDEMLVRTANQLAKAFPNGSVYRTGSDEFVVMVRSENGKPRTDVMIADVDNALRTLVVPQNIEGVGTLYPKYKVSVIRKTSGIDASVITILKEMTNAKGEAIVGMIDFSDLSD